MEKKLVSQIQEKYNIRTKLDSQLQENELVLKEFTLMKEDDQVFNMIGNALIKQDVAEAKANVQKRVDFIKSEIVRVDEQIKELQEKIKEFVEQKDKASQAQAAVVQ